MANVHNAVTGILDVAADLATMARSSHDPGSAAYARGAARRVRDSAVRLLDRMPPITEEELELVERAAGIEALLVEQGDG